MKISDSIKSVNGLTVEKVDTTPTQKPEVSRTAATGAGAESVTLSPLSSQLQSLEAKVAAGSVYDAEKVDAIKSAISSGQFTVNSEKVADGLISTVKELLTTS
jgi:negative regulator of flagellin synthesis FlgM